MRYDALIHELAGCQHGLVTRAQLTSAGVHPGAIDRRVVTGLLRVMHVGVYRVGPVTSPVAREMAAVLACGGRGAAVSHWSAAALRQQTAPAQNAPIDIIVSGRRRVRRPGVRVHLYVLAQEEITEIEGVPLTTLARTLLDLAAFVTERELERLVAQSERSGLVDTAALIAIAQRHRRHRGARKLANLLAADAAPSLTRSEAESQLLALVRKARLPAPAANVRVGAYEVDFLWRPQRLIVEVDGFAFHSSARAFEADRRRDAVLTASGLRVIRVTWQQITSEPEATLVNIAQALARVDHPDGRPLR